MLFMLLCGDRDSVIGIRCSVFGARCSVFGDNYSSVQLLTTSIVASQ